MQPARLIVCERMGQWAVALGRELAGSHVPMCHTRSLGECRDELADSPASLLALELSETNLPHILDQLEHVAARYPVARVVVLSARTMENYEWLLREMGAQHVASSPRQLAPVARLARRHLAEAPAAELTLSQQIMASLPWQD